MQLWDRIRAFAKSGNIYRIDNIYQDQSSLENLVQGGNFADLSKQSALLEQTNLQINRLERYKDYDMMDEVGEVSLALDLYADEASLIDPERKHSVIVKAENSRLKKAIEEFLYHTILIDSQIRPIIRYLAKYGDFAAEIVPTANRDGVASFRFINVYNFTRVQTKFGDLVGFYYQDPASSGPQFLHPWQVAHMRLTTFETVYHPYGRCAVQGTMVQTPTGEIPIESLNPQDEVYCFDGYQRIKTRVIDLVNNGMQMAYSLHTANRRLDLTNNHPVMLLDKHNQEISYKPVHQIQEGDLLLAPQPDGTVEAEGISRIEKRDKKQVFDIGVESVHHNFMANGAVVHNSILDGGRKDFKRLRLMEDAALVYRICVRGDTRVSTPDGYKYIKDIEIGDQVHYLDRNGQTKLTNVTNSICNGKDKIYRIFSRHREIFANSTHPILVVSPYKKNKKLYHDRMEFVDVRDLKTLQNTNSPYCHRFILPTIENDRPVRLKRPDVSQYVRLIEEVPVNCGIMALGKKVRLKATSISNFLSGSHHVPAAVAERVLERIDAAVSRNIDIYDCWSYCTQSGVGIEYNIPEYASEDFAQWFGFMIGDGFVSRRKNPCRSGCYLSEVGFALGDDVETNERYYKLFEKIAKKVSFGRDTDHRFGAYYVYSKHFVDFMLMNGFIPGASNKRVPDWVFRSPIQVQKAFVRGYLDADCNSRYFKGGITEGHAIECCNKQLVEDFKELIDRMGWTSGLIGHRHKKGGHVIDKKTGRKMPDTEAWTLYFTKEELPEHERILGVEEAGEDLIYDITVSAEEHNFIANMLPVSNTRAPEKRVFSIPVGMLPPREVNQYMEIIARQFKKIKFVDPATGSVNERYNPLIQDDDFFLPKRPDGSGPEIDTLPGAQNLDEIADIEYFKKKMVAGFKIPFGRLGIGESSDPDGKTLSQVSPEFAKNIQWIQREAAMGLKKLVIVHLALSGYSMEDIKNFELHMTAASAIDELYRIEVWNTRADIIANLKETGLFPDQWILERFTDMSKDEIKQMQASREMKDEVERLRAEAKNENQRMLVEEYAQFLSRMAYNEYTLEEEHNSNLEYMINTNELDQLPSKNKEGVLVESGVGKSEYDQAREETKKLLEGEFGGDQQVEAISNRMTMMEQASSDNGSSVQ